MKSLKLWILLTGFLISSIFLTLAQHVIAQPAINFYINQTSIILTTRGEAFADVTYSSMNPQSIETTYPTGMRNGEGLFDSTIQLGNSTDERDGCVQMQGLRRKGICEDGIYTIKTIDTDAAGNSSQPGFTYVERDTVKPAKPSVNLYLQGYDIWAEVVGEFGTSIIVNNNYSGVLNGNNIFVASGTCGNSYSFQFALVDLAENTSEPQESSIALPACPVVEGVDSNIYGTEQDPFAGKDGAVLGIASLEIESYITADSNKHDYVKSYYIPSPKITFVKEDINSITIYGLSIPKNHTVNIKTTLTEEYSSRCKILFWSRDCTKKIVSEKQYNDTLDHVGLSTYLTLGLPNPFDVEASWLWFDSNVWSQDKCTSESNGRWSCTFPSDFFSKNIPSPKIYARTQVWGETKTNFDGQDYIFTYSNNVNSPGSGISVKSVRSNSVNLANIYIYNQKMLIFNNYSVNIVDEGKAKWSLRELKSVEKALQRIAKSFYNSGNIVLIKRSVGQGSCESYVGGYVTPAEPNNVYICDVNNTDETLEGILIHELAHYYQKNASTQQIKYGANVSDNTSNILHKYYQILFNINANGYWDIDTNIIDNLNPQLPPTCSNYGNLESSINFPSKDQIFVSWYQCATSYRINELATNDPHVMPEEEMSETIRMFYQKTPNLVSKDIYFKNDSSSKNLGRCNFISINIDNSIECK